MAEACNRMTYEALGKFFGGGQVPDINFPALRQTWIWNRSGFFTRSFAVGLARVWWILGAVVGGARAKCSCPSL